MKYTASQQSKRIKKQKRHTEQTVIKLGVWNIQQKSAGEASGMVSSDPAFTTFRTGEAEAVTWQFPGHFVSMAELLTTPPPK